MSRIISVHSFRGGTGKSNTAASVAALLAAGGQRVGVSICGGPVTSRRPLTT